MTREILISVEGLYRYYGAYCAVNDVSFTVARGEVLGFLGPNGAGKSTTMQMISGVLTPGRGRVSIAGADIMDDPRAAKRQIGFLPEQPPLYPDLTVDEYLRYTAQLRGMPKPSITPALEQSKLRCGLTDTGRRLIGNLSKGYQQRVGIAQAIIHSPAVIILDEPTSGLDPIQIREIRELIRELGRDHSVILSTHILPEVQTVCGRVLIIHQGRLVLDRQLDNINTDQGHRHNCIRVAFKQPPGLSFITAIPGVMQAEQIDGQRYRIDVEPESGAIQMITRLAVEQDWGLLELVPQADSLEEIFMQLTSGARETTILPAAETCA